MPLPAAVAEMPRTPISRRSIEAKAEQKSDREHVPALRHHAEKRPDQRRIGAEQAR